MPCLLAVVMRKILTYWVFFLSWQCSQCHSRQTNATPKLIHASSALSKYACWKAHTAHTVNINLFCLASLNSLINDDDIMMLCEDLHASWSFELDIIRRKITSCSNQFWTNLFSCLEFWAFMSWQLFTQYHGHQASNEWCNNKIYLLFHTLQVWNVKSMFSSNML